MDKGEIVLYQPDDAVAVEVRLNEETVWLTQEQMVLLFGRERSVITKHIRNIFAEGELAEISTCAFFAQVQNEGGRMVKREIAYYNLDVIISVGYRVKSKQGTQFRIWATKILRDYLLKGYAVRHEIDVAKLYVNHENRIAELEKNVDFFVKTALPPIQGIFSQGQIFDAYVFAVDLIKSAKETVILIDNYINEKSLLTLSKRNKGVSAEIYTEQITSQLKLDLEKHNSQYEPIKINKLTIFHDRFVIVDGVVYHIGASLKDLGKGLFAFSRMNIKAEKLLE